MASIDVISRAEGILVSQLGLDPEDASWRLQWLASIQCKEKCEVAGNLLNGTLSAGLFTHPALQFR